MIEIECPFCKSSNLQIDLRVIKQEIHKRDGTIKYDKETNKISLIFQNSKKIKDGGVLLYCLSCSKTSPFLSIEEHYE